MSQKSSCECLRSDETAEAYGGAKNCEWSQQDLADGRALLSSAMRKLQRQRLPWGRWLGISTISDSKENTEDRRGKFRIVSYNAAVHVI
jgi:hypothetical protein